MERDELGQCHIVLTSSAAALQFSPTLLPSFEETHLGPMHAARHDVDKLRPSSVTVLPGHKKRVGHAALSPAGDCTAFWGDSPPESGVRFEIDIAFQYE